jgi:hypothetical protein
MKKKTRLTGYGLEGRGLIPGRDKIFHFSRASRPDLGPIQPPIQWVLGLFPSGVKWPRREADHSPPSAADVKNGGAITSRPHKFSWYMLNQLSTDAILLFLTVFVQ